MPVDELTCECTEKIMENSATACTQPSRNLFQFLSNIPLLPAQCSANGVVPWII